MNRSYLFVPGDSEHKFHKAVESGADAVIVDLEDSVAASQKRAARANLPGFLAATVRPEIWVRINPLGDLGGTADIDALENRLPAGIVLPKAEGANDIRALGERLAIIESAAGLEQGNTRVLPLVTETAAALFAVREYAQVPERIAALTWGAEDLAAAVGAAANRDASGAWLPPYELARSLCLIGAAAAAVPAVETVYTNIRNTDGLVQTARAARRDGFTGMLAIHPAQVAPINDAFTPEDDEIQRARRIVTLFEQQPEVGVVQLDGQMIDRPHYLQARRVLDVAERAASR